MVWLVAGVDEAGRGPIAGPVFAAAVILDPRRPVIGLADSKQLSPSQREQVFGAICQQVRAWAIGVATVAEIDALNILQATFLAMHRAVAQLTVTPQQVFIDGHQCPVLPYPMRAIVKGDQKVPAISAASIVAKVSRDRAMDALDQEYPHYGLAQHKGYPTAQHIKALRQYGPTAIHRRTFKPVAESWYDGRGGPSVSQ